MIRLKYLARFQKGRIPPELFEEQNTSQAPYLSMEYLRNQTNSPEFANIEGAVIAKDGDTILLWDGSNAGEFIKAKHGIVSSTAALVNVSNVEKGYFFYLCKSLEPRIRAETVGMGIPHVSGEFVGNLEIELPPEDIQKKVTSYLDWHIGRLDTLIAEKQQLLELLVEKCRSLLTHVVTQGLYPDVSCCDSGIPWLGNIPAHWQTSRIAWLFRERDERSQPNLPLLEVSIHGGVRLREFSDVRIEQVAADSNSYKVARKGDISFNKMRMWQGAVGHVPCDGLVSPDYVVADPIAPVNPVYYGLLFRTPALSAEAGSRSHGIVWDRLRLYWEEFRDIAVPVPPLTEQDEIVEFVHNENSKIALLAEATERTIALLQERRSALISAAVTGQLIVEESHACG